MLDNKIIDNIIDNKTQKNKKITKKQKRQIKITD